DLAGGYVVGCRRRNGDVLVPDVDGMYARQFGKGGRPVHVAVAHQDELRVDSLGKERFCEGFVESWHGRGTPAGGSNETLHYACAQAEGGIIFFVAAQESAIGTKRTFPVAPIHVRLWG